MFNIVDSSEMITTYFDSDLFTEETKERVKNADIILLPDLGKFEGISKAFRPDTKAFYKFAIANLDSGSHIKLFENKGEEQILNFHSHEIWLPVIYVKNIDALHTTLNLISNFALERQQRTKNTDLVINFNIKIENSQNDSCKNISFKGDLKELQDAISTIEMENFK